MRREKQSRSLSEIRMLAKAYAEENKGRNYLLFLAAVIFVVAFTLIFGIADGKIKAEYEKPMRDAGTGEATAVAQDADQTQYHVAESLFFHVKARKKRWCWRCGLERDPVLNSRAGSDGMGDDCSGFVWKFRKYPRGKQEIMMPVALERMGITQPKQGDGDLPLPWMYPYFDQSRYLSLKWMVYERGKDVGNRSVGYISEAKYQGVGIRFGGKKQNSG